MQHGSYWNIHDTLSTWTQRGKLDSVWLVLLSVVSFYYEVGKKQHSCCCREWPSYGQNKQNHKWCHKTQFCLWVVATFSICNNYLGQYNSDSSLYFCHFQCKGCHCAFTLGYQSCTLITSALSIIKPCYIFTHFFLCHLSVPQGPTVPTLWVVQVVWVRAKEVLSVWFRT